MVVVMIFLERADLDWEAEEEEEEEEEEGGEGGEKLSLLVTSTCAESPA